MSPKPKSNRRPGWTLYAVLDRRAFPDEVWLQRWLRLKDELGLPR
jgi:hypothetical protein